MTSSPGFPTGQSLIGPYLIGSCPTNQLGFIADETHDQRHNLVLGSR